MKSWRFLLYFVLTPQSFPSLCRSGNICVYTEAENWYRYFSGTSVRLRMGQKDASPLVTILKLFPHPLL